MEITNKNVYFLFLLHFILALNEERKEYWKIEKWEKRKNQRKEKQKIDRGKEKMWRKEKQTIYDREA